MVDTLKRRWRHQLPIPLSARFALQTTTVPEVCFTLDSVLKLVSCGKAARRSRLLGDPSLKVPPLNAGVRLHIGFRGR